MPVSIPVPSRSPGDLLTSALWNAQVKDNINKLLERGHRVLTVAQFAALTGLEGTKGTVAPDEVYLEVDSANGIQWHLAYESGEATYKWRFLGGPPLFAEVTTSESTTSSAYGDLATAGPSITTPRAGQYSINESARTVKPNADANHGCRMAPALGAAAAVDADSVYAGTVAATDLDVHSSRTIAIATLAASDIVRLKYRAESNTKTATFVNRRVEMYPLRLV